MDKNDCTPAQTAFRAWWNDHAAHIERVIGAEGAWHIFRDGWHAADASASASAETPQVVGRVWNDEGQGVAQLNSVGRALPDDTPLYAAPVSSELRTAAPQPKQPTVDDPDAPRGQSEELREADVAVGAAVPDERDSIIEQCAATVERMQTGHNHQDNKREDAHYRVAAERIRALKSTPIAESHERSSDARDAARYRWLRKTTYRDYPKSPDTDYETWWEWVWSRDESSIDKAIDEAMGTPIAASAKLTNEGSKT